MIEELRNKEGEKIEFAYHDATREGCVVVIGHGVTGNMDRPALLGLARGLAERGWPCLRISFSGNGGSEGRFEEATISKECDDLRAVLDEAAEGRRVAYIGHSMGGAVGLATAAQDERVGVLVSLAGMVRTRKFCEDEFGEVTPGEGCMWDEEDCPLSQEFVDDLTEIGDLLEVASGMETPVLFLHGTEDDVVLPVDSVDAHEVVPGVKKLVLVEGEGHAFGEAGIKLAVEEMDAWFRVHLMGGEKLENDG